MSQPSSSCHELYHKSALAVCARYRRRNIRCIKRERSFLFSALTRRPATGAFRIHEEKMRPMGAPPLTCRSEFEIVAVLRVNDLSALMLTLGATDFSRRTKVLRFRPQAYLHKTPRIIPYFPPTKKPPPKNRQGPTTNQSPSTNYGLRASSSCARFLFHSSNVIPLCFARNAAVNSSSALLATD